MLSRQNRTGTVASFLPTLCANLFVLLGVAVLGWRVAELVAVYWLAILTELLVYSGAALFARLPVVVEGRQFTLPGVTTPDRVGVRSDYERPEKWDRDPNPVELPGSLPPIYPRNVRLVVLSLVTGLGILGGFLYNYPRMVETLRSPSIALAAVGMFLSECQHLYREFVREKQYREMSAHMVLEIPGRLLFFTSLYVAVLGTVGIVVLALSVVVVQEATGVVVPEIPVELLVAVAVVVGMTAVEWSRFRAEREPNPSGFATWFLPEDPRE